MDRHEAVLKILTKHIKLNVDGLEHTEIRPEKSMVDYGASSLDIVEIVSAAMRELKIKIPRTELAKVKNIGQLVDLFVAVEQAPA
ncbi:phosphopantetheine-binding protein [Gloeobacter kilaueensis]|uniref:Acyl carrier protein n=1 Tax=Gloeobacter kilaueensis (strain ATCC BAA-2537 / CCAP 1431/1 / ULC 316 / JS1) TaxID=1183438 RepID=U5QK61_GLOK1|nr:phosphopantetheine-binding protein [Gloeobacter kilaueensis]AGY58070.1 acyl carrier protein [Gloeobacter kilaueensis JS1]